MRYIVCRSVTVKTRDVIESDKTLDEFKNWLDNEQYSLAGEISRLGIKGTHDQVSYNFNETEIIESHEIH